MTQPMNVDAGEDAEGYCDPVVIVRPRCACGKARYATEREAGRAVKRMKRHGKDRSYAGLLHPYLCPDNKRWWHVGHTDD